MMEAVGWDLLNDFSIVYFEDKEEYRSVVMIEGN